MSTLLWLLIACLYIVLFVALALTTLGKGHTVLFRIGIIFPIVWMIDALMGPTATADVRGTA
jgi:hypothetical protein